jgi:hypothetical protein
MIVKEDLTVNTLLKEHIETVIRYTEISSKIKPYFVINNFNYWDMIGYFMWVSTFYFKEKPGMDYILRFIYDLDRDIKGDLEIEPENCFSQAYVALARKICEKKGFRVIRIGKQSKQNLRDWLSQNAFAARNLLKVRIRMRHAIGVIRRMLNKHDAGEKDVLFLANIRFCNRTPENNSLFGGLAETLKDKRIDSKFLIYEELMLSSNLKRFIREFMLKKNSYIGDYYDSKQFRQCNQEFKLLRKRWNDVKDKPEFKQLFSYKDINFYDEIRPRLDLIFNLLIYLVLDAKNITENIIKKEKYKVLVLDHEENLYGKGFLLNTRTNMKKRTIALSHEIIYPGCVHTYTRDKMALNKNSLSWRPLPDAKCVWGEYAKEILLNHCNYSPSLIHVTGNPKFDSITNKKYNPQDIESKYPFLNTNKKKLLIASDALYSNYPFYKEIIRKNKDLLIILKPHPLEDMNTMRKIFNVKSGDFVMIDKTADLYEFICCSDYVMTFSSTAAFEAMLFSKPVFILNPQKLSMTGLPYLENNSAFEIRGFDDLQKILKKLENPLEREKLRQRVKKFVNEINYKSDGKATVRVADIIEQNLSELKRGKEK